MSQGIALAFFEKRFFFSYAREKFFVYRKKFDILKKAIIESYLQRNHLLLNLFYIHSEELLESFRTMKLPELKEKAAALGLKSVYRYRKKELIDWLEHHAQEEEESGSDQKTAPSKGMAQPLVSVEKEGAEEEEPEEKPSFPEEKDEKPALLEETADQAENREEAAEKPFDPKVEFKSYPTATGYLEIMNDGYGFLRTEGDGDKKDYYMPAAHIRRFELKTGDMVEGIVGEARDREKYAPIIYLNTVNGTSPMEFKHRSTFDNLTPVYANERIQLEQGMADVSNRIVDLVAPIGKGQRGLIVSPPKAGKTTLLKSIARSVEAKYPEIYLFILLIDERPEEVTDFEWSVNQMRKSDDPIRTEVIASTFDKTAQNHTIIAEELLERAKRLVESGQDVMILLDSLTRLSRAYNIVTPPSGRTLSGGLDPVALYPPKAFFGAARNIDGEGSLTILATCLRDTGSRMDDMIYEEFKGTGNMEIHLNRNLAELRIFPAIDIFASGTRRDDLLLTEEEEKTLIRIRREGRQQNPIDTMEQFVRLIKNTKSNKDFCELILKKQF